MSKDKTTTSQESTQQAKATPEETELNRLLLEQTRAAQPGVLQAQEQSLGLVNQLLAGGELPGYLNQLTKGISNEAIGTQASSLAKQYGAGFQNLGIADSGVAFRETARGISNDLLYPTEQFNIGNLQNLLNLAMSGQAQVQAPIQGASGQVSSNLQGLRTINSSGSSTTLAANPFLKSFQQSLGSGLGTGVAGGIGGGIGGFKTGWGNALSPKGGG